MAAPVTVPDGFVLDGQKGLPAEPTTADALARMGQQPSAGRSGLPAGFVVDEPAPPSVAYDISRQGVGNIAKGIVNTLGLPYEGVRYLLDQGVSIPGVGSASPGIKMPALADMDLYKPWTQQPKAETTAGRYAASAGDAVGSSAVPALGIMQKASQLKRSASAVPSVAERFLRPIAERPGLATGLDVASATGSGLAKQTAEEAGGGPGVQATASILGGVATPLAVMGVARGANALGRTAFDAIPKVYMSADGGMPPNVARDRAIQMIADQLTKAGVSPDEIERRLATIDWSRTFHTSGHAPDAMTLADLDESLAKLLGSAVRQQPEAANTTRGFLRARQTGLEPEQPLHPGAGIPTRQSMSRPITGTEAQEQFGTDFRAGQKNLVPMGQHERGVAGLKRALRISDADYHGHAANANRTDDQIAEAGKALSKPAYLETYRAGNGVDLQPHLAPVVQKWTAIAAADGNEPIEVARFINAMLQRFGTVRNIQQFDKNKQFALDAKIDKLFTSPEGRNRYFGGRLSELKDDLLAAVDGIKTNNLGAKYAEARDIFSSHADARRVLKMGRDAFGEDSDIGVDAFNALTSKGDQKLFRLGYLGAYEKKSASMPDGADRTRIFANPRQRELLANIIERTETATGRDKIIHGAPAEFADRPQRFGAFQDDEGRMIRTREIVSGNSKTAERLADDEAFDTLHTVLDIFKDPRLISIGKRSLEYALNKSFGMRADTSAALAQQLLTAEPARRAALVQAIRARMSSSRFQRFSELMTEHLRQSATGTIGGSTATLDYEPQR